MATITSTGAGSGLNVSSLVTQLVAAERAPYDKQIATADAKLTTEFSALSKLKAAMSSFQSALGAMKDADAFAQRKVTIGGRTGRKGRKHEPQGNERKIRDGELDRAAERVRGQGAHIGAFHDRDPLIGAKRPGELAVTDVDGIDMSGAGPQQHIGETAGRGTGVETPPPGHSEATEGRERTAQLVTAPRDEVVG